jgi:hypothetical protein
MPAANSGGIEAAAYEAVLRQYVDSYWARIDPELLERLREAMRKGLAFGPHEMSRVTVTDLQVAARQMGVSLDELRRIWEGTVVLYGYGDVVAKARELVPNADQAALDISPDLRKAKEEAAAFEKLNRDVEAFADELMRPLDLNDPTVRAIINDVQGRLTRGLFATGAGGGMAQAAYAKGVGDAALNLEMQRRALGAQLKSQQIGNRFQLMAYKDQAARMALNEQYQNELADWEANRGGLQTALSVGGGILGGIIGGVASYGNPMAISAGASAGSALGAGIGGAAAGGPPRAPVYYSPYFGYSSMSTPRMGY